MNRRPRDKPPSSRSGVSMMQIKCGYSFAQGDNVIPRSWILLDTCSTCSSSKNADLVHCIRTCTAEEISTVHTNGGSKTFTELGMFILLPIEVHYNPTFLTHVLSFDAVAKVEGVRITLDTNIECGFRVTYHDMSLKFLTCADGLYYFDKDSLKSKSPISEHSSLGTVRTKYSFFSNCESK